MASKYNVKVQYAAWVAVCTLAAVVIMTAAHFALQSEALEQAAVTRARITADTLAKAVEGSLAIKDAKALPGLIARTVNDEEVCDIHIRDATGEELYRPSSAGEIVADLIQVEVPVGDPQQPVGTVEIGLAPTDMNRALMRTILLDLGIGLAVVIAATAASFYASAPVRRGLEQLQEFVKCVDANQPRTEMVDSDLAEVDAVSRKLNDLLSKVRQAQAATANAQKQLKAAQKEMDEYTYVISHDLKEPLRGIEAFSKFLVEDHRDKLDDDGRHHIDVIRSSALRMQRLINDLLKFSRLGQKKNPSNEVGLNTMMMHVRLNLQFALDAKKADLRVNRLPTVVCEPTAMTEVFHNLISNAIKYNDKPHPVIEVGYVEQDNPETKRPEYVFHVSDNGPGIKTEHYEKIFQLFQRLHRDDEGTGIGLTIVKRVVEWHGGRIWVESVLGEGTTFYFTLPKQPAVEPPAAPPAEPRPAPEGEPQLATTV